MSGLTYAEVVDLPSTVFFGMGEVKYVQFTRNKRFFMTKGLNGCFAVFLVCPTAAIGAHIPPHPGFEDTRLKAGPKNMKRMMQDFEDLYNAHKSEFTPRRAFVVVACSEGKAELPKEQKYIEKQLSRLDPYAKMMKYEMRLRQDRSIEHGSTFIDGRNESGAMLYLEDKPTQIFSASVMPTSETSGMKSGGTSVSGPPSSRHGPSKSDFGRDAQRGSTPTHYRTHIFEEDPSGDTPSGFAGGGRDPSPRSQGGNVRERLPDRTHDRPPRSQGGNVRDRLPDRTHDRSRSPNPFVSRRKEPRRSHSPEATDRHGQTQRQRPEPDRRQITPSRRSRSPETTDKHGQTQRQRPRTDRRQNTPPIDDLPRGLTEVRSSYDARNRVHYVYHNGTEWPMNLDNWIRREQKRGPDKLFHRRSGLWTFDQAQVSGRR